MIYLQSDSSRQNERAQIKSEIKEKQQLTPQIHKILFKNTTVIWQQIGWPEGINKFLDTHSFSRINQDKTENQTEQWLITK